MGSCMSTSDEQPEKPVRRAPASAAAKPVNLKDNSSTSVANENLNNSLETHEPKAAIMKSEPENDAVAETDDKEFKILLLGSGESGKSTILKQMKIIHQDGYSESELRDYKPFVYRNLLECAKSIAGCYKDFKYPISADVELKKLPTLNVDQSTAYKFQKDFENNDDIDGSDVSPLTESDLDYILGASTSSSTDDVFDPKLASAIASLWKANSTKNLLIDHSSDFYLMDSARYFFQNLHRISQPDYLPNVTDVLRTRKKTSGIFETRFNMGNTKIHMVDVGGQRSERKKWIHCFDNVTIIIFCVSLSEYDQTLLEEKSQNRLEESVVLFDSVVNSRWFSRTSIVLFLNKIDVFAEKLQHSPLENYFPDYTGGNNITNAAKYVLWRFKQVNRSKLTMYTHVTQATDTTNIKLVFAAVQETVLNNSLKDSGIITI